VTVGADANFWRQNHCAVIDSGHYRASVSALGRHPAAIGRHGATPHLMLDFLLGLSTAMAATRTAHTTHIAPVVVRHRRAIVTVNVNLNATNAGIKGRLWLEAAMAVI
jgi:hypothetical protein